MHTNTFIILSIQLAREAPIRATTPLALFLEEIGFAKRRGLIFPSPTCTFAGRLGSPPFPRKSNLAGALRFLWLMETPSWEAHRGSFPPSVQHPCYLLPPGSLPAKAEENGKGSKEKGQRGWGMTAQGSLALGLLVAHQKSCSYTIKARKEQ